MKRSWIFTIITMFTLISMCITAENALAQSTVSGTVSAIDASSVTVTKEGGGGSVRGQAAPNVLAGVKVGDKVNMTMAGNRVMALSKKR